MSANYRGNKKTRKEKDFLGEVMVPAEAYYGIQTVRAMENFPISGLKEHAAMIKAAALIKKSTARANSDLGRLDKKRAAAIVRACGEVIAGRFDDQFVVDVFQMGAGTSFHMNINEVVANRASEIMGGGKGADALVDPHDHVNIGQSTNDVYPTAMRLAAALMLRDRLLPELEKTVRVFSAKSREFGRVVKSGRTHLQDAVPIRLSQEFRAYGKTIARCRRFIETAGRSLLQLGIGGSAVGTGLNTPPGYRDLVLRRLSQMTGLKLKPAEDLREAMQSMRPFVEVSAALRNLAGELNRIANDLRLLASGPRAGLAEISLPEVAPGSSIIPHKVNPSMLEMLNMVCYQVMGCDLTVSQAAQAGQLELNVMMPVIAFNLQLMIVITANALRQVRVKCLRDIKADAARCREYAERALGLATVLSPRLGYDRAAGVAAEALKRGKTIREIVEEKGILEPAELDRLFDLEGLTEPPPERPRRRGSEKNRARN